MSGHEIILITALIGGLIIAGGIYFGTKRNDKASQKENLKIIEDLRDSLNQESELLRKSQAENIQLSEKILVFQEKLDINTEALTTISTDISKVSVNTNTLVQAVQNELKEKGEFDILIPNTSSYGFPIGGNYYDLGRNTLENGYDVVIPPFGIIPIHLRIRNDKLLISTRIYDEEGKLVVIIHENEWALNKSRNFSINFDKKALEVIDQRGIIVLQVEIEGLNFKINMLTYRSNSCLIVSSAGIYIIDKSNKDISERIQTYSKIVKPIFSHLGENYIGRRLNL